MEASKNIEELREIRGCLSRHVSLCVCGLIILQVTYSLYGLCFEHEKFQHNVSQAVYFNKRNIPRVGEG